MFIILYISSSAVVRDISSLERSLFHDSKHYYYDYGHISFVQGAKLIVLTDRKVSSECVPIPAALAAGAVHQALLKDRSRLKVCLCIKKMQLYQ